MKRTLTNIAAAGVVLGSLVPRAFQTTDLFTMPKRKLSKKVWTCNKCKNKFTPNISARLCDKCAR